MKKKPLYDPFDFSYTIRFSGVTKSDGVITVTAQMIRDSVYAVLQTAIDSEMIHEFSITLPVDNIRDAKNTIRKNRRLPAYKRSYTGNTIHHAGRRSH